MQYKYSKKMFNLRSKPIWLIGDPDNQLPDKWSSTLCGFQLDEKMVMNDD